MSHWTERWRGRATLGALALAGARAGAQTSPASRDTARADSLRRPITDSTSRDSIVAGQLRAVARRPHRSLVDLVNVDQLRLTEIGLSGGLAFPDQVRRATLYALHADYGEIVPRFRVVFGASYWTSRYSDAAVTEFGQALGRVAGRGPTDPPVDVGPVRSTDVALAAETRWRPSILGGTGAVRRASERLWPWVALGAGAHFINVQNPALDGTFVARTLDGVAFGPTGAIGADLALFANLRLSAEARYDLFNGARFGSIRAGGGYVFERRAR